MKVKITHVSKLENSQSLNTKFQLTDLTPIMQNVKNSRQFVQFAIITRQNSEWFQFYPTVYNRFAEYESKNYPLVSKLENSQSLNTKFQLTDLTPIMQNSYKFATVCAFKN